MCFGLKKEIIEEVREVLKEEKKIEKGYIFGSRARGDYTKSSDIDLAIYAKKMDSTQFNLLRDELEQLDIIHKIDVIDVYRVSRERLIENIEREGEVIYRRGE